MSDEVLSPDLALSALNSMAQGVQLKIDDRLYAMADDCDIIQVASSDHGEIYHLRVDVTFGQWVRYIDSLKDDQKLYLAFQIGMKA